MEMGSRHRHREGEIGLLKTMREFYTQENMFPRKLP
jgi:hypothetical protein